MPPTPFPPPADAPIATIATLLQNMHRLGLPHFQRGAVWNDTDMGRLLESLYLDTPCGTVILWRPLANIDDKGVPFPVEMATPCRPEFLVIDGQQRLTALWRAFRADTDRSLWPTEEGDEDDSPAIKHPPRWFLNLTRLGLVPAGVASTHDQRAPLFVRTCRRSAALIDLRQPQRPAYLGDDDWQRVLANLQAMTERRLYVVLKEESPGQFTESDIVSLYNRINSSGRAVREHERAYAEMVAIHEQASDWLRDVYHQAFPRSDGAHARSWLAPQRERNFGMELFVRAFVLAASHHADEPTLDLSKISEHTDLGRLLRDPSRRADVQALFDETRTALGLIIGVIRDTTRGLACDDARFAPPVDAVRVVLHLLLKYPQCDQRVPGIVAGLLLRLSLRPLPFDVGPVLKAIHRSHGLGEALEGIAGEALRFEVAAGTDHRLQVDLTTPQEEQLAALLESAQSVQAAATSVLYWLQRRNHTCDLFDFAMGMPLSAAMHPQADHTIPFRVLAEPFGLHGRGRPQSHEVHRLGNLTWLSEKSNWNKSDDPTVPPTVPDAVLRAHYLIEPNRTRNGSPLFALREVAVSACKAPGGDAALACEAFRAYARARTSLITADLGRWLAALSWPDTAPDDAPLPQRLVSSLSDRVLEAARREGWHPAVRESVLVLARDHRLRADTVRNTETCLLVVYQSPGTTRSSGVDHTIRVSTDGRRVLVGWKIAERTALLTAMGGEPRFSETRDRFEDLDPASEWTGVALRALVQDLMRRAKRQQAG